MTTIVLVGLMGSGKSTVGRIVAERLDRPMVDSDVTIAARTGTSVRELWEQGGEPAYRRLESQVVLDALANTTPSVVAAPGGAVLDPDVVDALGVGFVVWLRADPAVLAGRVHVGDHRPLLGADPEAALTTMARERADLYGRVADVVVDIDELGPAAVADRVVEAYERRQTTL